MRVPHLQLRLQGVLTVVLVLLVAGLLGYLSNTYNQRLDWTSAGRNSLSGATRTLLAGLKGEYRAVVFARPSETARAPIQDLLARYSAAYPALKIEYINPDAAPARVREYAIRTDGTVVLERAGRREKLEQLDEQSVTNALMRLGRDGTRGVSVLTGHGERALSGSAPQALTSFAKALRDQGLEARALTLAPGQALNTGGTLLLSMPQVGLQAGESKALEDYLAGGGNALILLDPAPLNGLDGVLNVLGVTLLPGTVVDPVGQIYTGNAAFALATGPDYKPHETLRGFDLSTIFVLAGALRAVAPAGWTAQPLIETARQGWLESGSLDQAVSLDAGTDTPGPVTVAYALTRALGEGKGQQRVIVVADGDFLSDAYLGTGGNLTLGLNFMNWLTGDAGFVNVPPRVAGDLSLQLSARAQLGIGFGFLFGLPALFAASGLGIWLRRRRR